MCFASDSNRTSPILTAPTELSSAAPKPSAVSLQSWRFSMRNTVTGNGNLGRLLWSCPKAWRLECRRRSERCGPVCTGGQAWSRHPGIRTYRLEAWESDLLCKVTWACWAALHGTGVVYSMLRCLNQQGCFALTATWCHVYLPIPTKLGLANLRWSSAWEAGTKAPGIIGQKDCRLAGVDFPEASLIVVHPLVVLLWDDKSNHSRCTSSYLASHRWSLCSSWEYYLMASAELGAGACLQWMS